MCGATPRLTGWGASSLHTSRPSCEPARRAVGFGGLGAGTLGEIARRRGLEFQLVLSEFAIERLLYRLGASIHRDRFVVKGATLFRLWAVGERRATWDLDLLGRGFSRVDDVVAVVRELCEMPADDAIEFDALSLRGGEIRSPDEYGGVRVRFVARLAGAEIPVQIDVGFGDAVEPVLRIEPYPTLLDHAAPHVLVYRRETLVRGIRATFARPGTAMPVEELMALFSQDQSECASGARSSGEAVSRRPLGVRRVPMSCVGSYFLSLRPPGDPASPWSAGLPVVRGRNGDDEPHGMPGAPTTAIEIRRPARQRSGGPRCQSRRGPTLGATCGAFLISMGFNLTDPPSMTYT